MIKFTDSTLMPFGRHQGKKLANVPASYLLWAYNNLQLLAPLKEYIEDNMKALETEKRKEEEERKRMNRLLSR